MKILISNAVWGKTYCSVFTRFSLATLLASNNIPELAKSATITFHVVTTKRDRRQLSSDPAIVELQRYCQIEWEVIEDFGIFQPPEGSGGEKYPFLSALQNLAIKRAFDHDVIVFNYADFIWTNGSLTSAMELLVEGEKHFDAVLAFCLPVDRDPALPVLERYRQASHDNVIDLAPREGAKVAVENMHREAKNRLWNSPGFTVTPSYLMWEVDSQGVVARAYHQTILALRVRANDPDYQQGIVRGSLDACLTAQLAKSGTVAFASDTERVLVFSLYHTPVDSRLPVGVTREMSLQNLLRGDVTPEQRPFAERPIFLKLRDGDDALWKKVSNESWNLLQRAHDTTDFDRALYNKNLETHGVIPEISRHNALRRHIFQPLMAFIRWTRIMPAIGRLLSAGYRILSRIFRRILRICFVLVHPLFLRRALKRRLKRLGIRTRRRGFYAAPNIWVRRRAVAPFTEALVVESSASKTSDNAQLSFNVRKAEQLLRRAIEMAPPWIDPVRALGRNLWFQGRFDEAIQTFGVAERMRDEMARLAGWPADSCVFLPRNCARSIGLMGHLDAFVKHRILTNDPRPYYLLAPPEDIVNNVFLDYWKEHIRIVSEQEEIERLAPLEPVYGVNWNWVMPQDGKLVFVHAGIAAVERAWQSAGRQPLFRLRSTHAELLQKARAKWGMKEGERFVCLHVRSDGFYGQSTENAQRFRNTAIDSYYALIRAVTDMGLWVIRMGDASMPPLDPAQSGASGRVVDYALSLDRSAELDVALCAQCELFVSSPSGLHTVAHAFGRPVCEVNYPIYKGFPWHPKNIFIPQLYFSHAKGRVLTLEEILGTDVIHRDHQFLLDQAGISLLSNEPEDIVETVREALAPSTYSVSDAALADRVCAAFEELNRKHDIGISGQLGHYFAMKYASQLLPDGKNVQDATRAVRPPKGRKLDFLIPCFNRPKYLHHILKTGLALEIPGAYFVVIDDASHVFDDVPGLGSVTAEMVCQSFNDSRVVYTRNPVNMGVAKSLERYYRELCNAEYTSLLNPKDEFINGAPIVEALSKLDVDPKISFVVYPLHQIDRYEADKPLLCDYSRMSGREFVAAHVRDSMLQHCSGYAVTRVSALRKAGIPRNLDLRALGLEDASGIDHEMIFNLATTGDVDFVSAAPIRRKIVGGYTEQYPLTFAYTQYQYARRLMRELEPRGFVSAATRRQYLAFWHLIIARGLVVAYRHVHGSEREQGVKRIRPHLRMPILLYLPYEMLRSRVVPRRETVVTYFVGAWLLLTDWLRKILGLPYVA